MHFFPYGNEATEESTGELEAAKAAGITDHACCAFITSIRQKYPSYMSEEGTCPVTVGAPFPMLSNHTAWVALSAYISDELLNWDSTAFQNARCTL